MSRISFIWAVLLVSLLPLVGCAKGKGTWQLYGENLLGTSSPDSAIQTAIQHAHDKIGRYVMQPNGSTSDPSFQIKSESWQREKGRERVTRTIARFNDTEDKPVIIDVVQNDGSETLIFIEYAGAGGPLTVLNRLKESLELQGTKRRDR